MAIADCGLEQLGISNTMEMRDMNKTALALTGAVAIFSGLCAQEPGGSDLKDRLILDTRVRFESVDQQWGGDADALTLRARLGFESEDYDGFQFLIEGEFSGSADSGDFDAYPGAAGTPGKAVIADGKTAELNRAQIKYSSGDFTAILGRQRIILDNARFVGNLGWRQNEQTYDAATFVYKPSAQSQLVYAYVDRVQRIFGSEAVATAQRRLNTEAHVVNFNYKPDESSQYGLYLYDLGVKTAPGASSSTLGGFYQGSVDLENGWNMTSRFEYAKQFDNSTSPASADFSLDYLHAFVSGKKDALTLGFGWEILDGDGARGFSTPLATLHAFNGWADVFLATPALGLDDKYVWAGYKFDASKSAKLVYHQFESDRGGIGYGDEVDLVFGWKLSDAATLTAKYANYNGKRTGPGGLKIDRSKLWLQVDYKY